MEVVAHLIDVAIYQLPINSKVEVTRNEHQSIASKNCKAKQKSDARGDASSYLKCHITTYFRLSLILLLLFMSRQLSAAAFRKVHKILILFIYLIVKFILLVLVNNHCRI